MYPSHHHHHQCDHYHCHYHHNEWRYVTYVITSYTDSNTIITSSTTTTTTLLSRSSLELLISFAPHGSSIVSGLGSIMFFWFVWLFTVCFLNQSCGTFRELCVGPHNHHHNDWNVHYPHHHCHPHHNCHHQYCIIITITTTTTLNTTIIIGSAYPSVISDQASELMLHIITNKRRIHTWWVQRREDWTTGLQVYNKINVKIMSSGTKHFSPGLWGRQEFWMDYNTMRYHHKSAVYKVMSS